MLEPSTGAGRSRCSTEPWTDSGPNSCSMDALDHFNRPKVSLLDQAETPYVALAREMGDGN
jgi:hypothetical protein